MERGKGEMAPGHWEFVESSGWRISGEQRNERKTCAKMCENLARWPAGRRCEFRSFGLCMPQTEMFQMNRELPLLIDDGLCMPRTEMFQMNRELPLLIENEEDHLLNSVTTSFPEIGVWVKLEFISSLSWHRLIIIFPMSNQNLTCVRSNWTLPDLEFIFGWLSVWSSVRVRRS